MKFTSLAPALLGALAMAGFMAKLARAQDIVPGSGRRLTEVGDDFEDPKWTFNLNLPKSSKNIDGQTRLPGGRSENTRWYEPELRGEPDVVRRVPTPEGGLPGSKGSMLMQTLWSGIPGRPSYKPQQDDLCADVDGKVGNLPIWQMPSVVVRVYVPPFDKWEQRTGNSFGFRAAVTTTKMTSSGGWRFNSSYRKTEPYWPGMFINFNSKKDSGAKEDSANFVIRGDELGRDVAGPPITQTGWWTLGISFGANGQANYYIKQGVGNLTAKDHVVSYFPYGYHAELFETFFFDLVNMDDGKSWSTPWIVDDPMVYVGR
jgi:hypothetical protein